MTITLGDVPDELVINLSANSPFITTMQRSEGVVWDSNAVIELHIGSTVWSASIVELNASWSLSAEEVNSVIDERHAELWFDGTLWAVGSVIRNA